MSGTRYPFQPKHPNSQLRPLETAWERQGSTEDDSMSHPWTGLLCGYLVAQERKVGRWDDDPKMDSGSEMANVNLISTMCRIARKAG
ncbi:hypothetical protein CIB48_g7554 [Xylaria polymorpha]|nr:hypothetical protein CIB48_g7554 [Xylaria polymorpha]